MSILLFISNFNVISNRSVRASCLDQVSLIATMCCLSQGILVNFIQLLYSHLNSTVCQNYLTSHEFFQLFCRLLNSASSVKCDLPLLQELVEFEIDLIYNVG